MSTSSSCHSRIWRSSDVFSATASCRDSLRSAYTRSSKSTTSCSEVLMMASRSDWSRSWSSLVSASCKFRSFCRRASVWTRRRMSTVGRSFARACSSIPEAWLHRLPDTSGRASADSGMLAIGTSVPNCPGGKTARVRTSERTWPVAATSGSTSALKSPLLSTCSRTLLRQASVTLSRHSGNSSAWAAGTRIFAALSASCSSSSMSWTLSRREAKMSTILSDAHVASSLQEKEEVPAFAVGVHLLVLRHHVQRRALQLEVPHEVASVLNGLQIARVFGVLRWFLCLHLRQAASALHAKELANLKGALLLVLVVGRARARVPSRIRVSCGSRRLVWPGVGSGCRAALARAAVEGLVDVHLVERRHGLLREARHSECLHASGLGVEDAVLPDGMHRHGLGSGAAHEVPPHLLQQLGDLLGLVRALLHDFLEGVDPLLGQACLVRRVNHEVVSHQLPLRAFLRVVLKDDSSVGLAHLRHALPHFVLLLLGFQPPQVLFGLQLGVLNAHILRRWHARRFRCRCGCVALPHQVGQLLLPLALQQRLASLFRGAHGGHHLGMQCRAILHDALRVHRVHKQQAVTAGGNHVPAVGSQRSRSDATSATVVAIASSVRRQAPARSNAHDTRRGTRQQRLGALEGRPAQQPPLRTRFLAQRVAPQRDRAERGVAFDVLLLDLRGGVLGGGLQCRQGPAVLLLDDVLFHSLVVEYPRRNATQLEGLAGGRLHQLRVAEGHLQHSAEAARGQQRLAIVPPRQAERKGPGLRLRSGGIDGRLHEADGVQNLACPDHSEEEDDPVRAAGCEEAPIRRVLHGQDFALVRFHYDLSRPRGLAVLPAREAHQARHAVLKAHEDAGGAVVNHLGHPLHASRPMLEGALAQALATRVVPSPQEAII
eukprot:scaffold63_cov306-Pinguiococcus_pyrenoidosus.AAC.89